MSVCVISLPVFSYARGSHDDMRFEFDMGRFNFTQYTASRYKYETSPIYCKVNYISTSGQSVKMSAVRGDYSESTFTPITYVTKPGIYKLSSNITEDARYIGTNSSARIRCQKYSSFDKALVRGLWSPDSY